MTSTDPIFKIVTSEQWQHAEKQGVFKGAPVDLVDGYIHFSTARQVSETASRHFSGQDDLLLLTVDPEALGAELVFEPSRGGELFPHLYKELPLGAVRSVEPLPLGDDGRHQFPEVAKPSN